MASSYMRKFRKDQEEARDQKISAAENKLSNLVRDNNNKKFKSTEPSESLMKDNIGTVLVISVILGIIIPVVGFILCLGACWLIDSMKASQVQEERTAINAQLEAENKRATEKCVKECAVYREECRRAIEAEEKRYLTGTKKARQVYGGSTQLDSVVKWLADHFEQNIRGASREPFNERITAQLRYQVSERELVTTLHTPHSGLYQPVEHFDFFQNRLIGPSDFLEQIGLAQALAQRLKFEMHRRFPQDPIAPSRGFIPEITFDYDDTAIHMHYSVQNPNYRPAVHMRTGIGPNG